MIAAVVHCAEWDHSPDDFRIVHQGEPQPQTPALLSEFRLFRRYGLPPNAGGMRDQPLNWFEDGEKLEWCYRVWRAWMACDKGPEWRGAHPAETATALQLREIVYGK